MNSLAPFLVPRNFSNIKNLELSSFPLESDEHIISPSNQIDNYSTNHLLLLNSSSNATISRRLNLMDFFDIRKFQTHHRDFVLNENGRFQVISDYSLVALLPVILVACLIATIFCIYRFRQWKNHKKQIAELDAFYEILETSPCLSSKSYLIQHCLEPGKSDCDRITRAVCVPSTGSSAFFQPIPPKAKSTRCSGNVMKAVNASEVIFHFAQLPPSEKCAKPSKTLVHTV